MNFKNLIYNLKLRLQKDLKLVRPFERKGISIDEYSDPKFKHTFFGYYDRSPWSPDHRKLLYFATDADDYRDEAKTGVIGYFDLDSRSCSHIGETNSWNFQQAAQQQWVNDEHILYNDQSDGEAFSKICQLDGKEVMRFSGHSGMLHRETGLVASYDYHCLYEREIDYGYLGLKSDRDSSKILLRIVQCASGDCVCEIAKDEGSSMPCERSSLC